MNCPICRSKVNGDAKFCGQCGRSIVPIGPSLWPKVAIFASMVVVAIIVLGLMGSSMQDTPVTYRITYQVSGSANYADILFSNATKGDDSESAGIQDPWEKSVILHYGERAYISAQNRGESGSVRVSISENGKLMKRAESTGAYAIASAIHIVGASE